MTSKEKALITFAIYKKAKEAAGIETDYAVAQLAGVRQGMICDWKHGRYTPKHDKLMKIAKVLNVPVSVFYVERSR